MIVWLVDFDGKIENLALMKLSTYWKRQGATVCLKHGQLNRAGEITDPFLFPNLVENPDKVFISCIFRWHRDEALYLARAWGDRAEIGGTGTDITRMLPPEVETCEPDYSLYGEDRAIGFISRGCPNKCPWCVVWRKEGKVHRVSSVQNVVDGRSSLLALDNNFLALPGHLGDLQWLYEHNIAIDFNQGLDARRVTEDNADWLACQNWSSGPRFALDSDSRGQKAALENALNLLEKYDLPRNQVLVYVLIGFDGLQSDIARLMYVHELGARAYPMGFRNLDTGAEPMTGWNRVLYKKFRRLIIRIPFGKDVWKDFDREVVKCATE